MTYLKFLPLFLMLFLSGSPATIKFHSTIQGTTGQSPKTICQAVELGYQMSGISYESVTAWESTEGAVGWRVSSVFPNPGPSPEQIIAAIQAGLTASHIQYSPPVTAWVHP
jgi:hypothetical protein